MRLFLAAVYGCLRSPDSIPATVRNTNVNRWARLVAVGEPKLT